MFWLGNKKINLLLHTLNKTPGLENGVCLYLNELLNTFTMEANIMIPDQTVPKGAVWSGSILFAKKTTSTRDEI